MKRAFSHGFIAFFEITVAAKVVLHTFSTFSLPLITLSCENRDWGITGGVITENDQPVL